MSDAIIQTGISKMAVLEQLNKAANDTIAAQQEQIDALLADRDNIIKSLEHSTVVLQSVRKGTLDIGSIAHLMGWED